MWTYNYTYIRSNELMHYGVVGMRWGHRKKYSNPDGSLNELGKARKGYEDAKRAAKQFNKTKKKSFGITVKGVEIQNKNLAKSREHDLDIIDARAKYKAAKQKSKVKANEAEFNTYVKEMTKSGLPGSMTDKLNGLNKSKDLYNRISTKKGKEYADKVQKKVEKKVISNLVSSTIFGVGMTAASIYLNISSLK